MTTMRTTCNLPEHIVSATTVGVLTGDSTLVHPVPDQTVRVEEGSLTCLTHVRTVF